MKFHLVKHIHRFGLSTCYTKKEGNKEGREDHATSCDQGKGTIEQKEEAKMTPEELTTLTILYCA